MFAKRRGPAAGRRKAPSDSNSSGSSSDEEKRTIKGKGKEKNDNNRRKKKERDSSSDSEDEKEKKERKEEDSTIIISDEDSEDDTSLPTVEFFQVKKSKASRRMAKGILQKNKKRKKPQPGDIILPDTDPSEEEDDLEADINDAKLKEDAQVAREKREMQRQGRVTSKVKELEQRRSFFKPKVEQRPEKSTEAFDFVFSPTKNRGKETSPICEDKFSKRLCSSRALEDLEKLIEKAKDREGDANTRKVTEKEELKDAITTMEQTRHQIEQAKIQRELFLDIEDLVRDIEGLIEEKAGKIADAAETLRMMERDVSLQRWKGEDEFGRQAVWPSTSFMEDRRSFLSAVQNQLLKDIGDDFSSLKNILEPFGEMKGKYRGLYTSSYIPLSMKEVVQTHVKLELLWWDPLHFAGCGFGERVAGRPIVTAAFFDDFDWFKALCDYSMDEFDPDSNLIPSVIIHEIFPIITHYVDIWDMRDPSETKLLRDVIEEASAFLDQGKDDPRILELEKKIEGRMGKVKLTAHEACQVAKNISELHGVLNDDCLGPLLVKLWTDFISAEPPRHRWSLLLDMMPDNSLKVYFQPMANTLTESGDHRLHQLTKDIFEKLQGSTDMSADMLTEVDMSLDMTRDMGGDMDMVM